MIPKSAKARTDEVNPEVLSLLRRAGFRILTLGAESFDDVVLQGMHKGVTGRLNETAIEDTLAAGNKAWHQPNLLFTLGDRELSLLRTVCKTLPFVEKGAYVNAMTEMHTQVGDRFSACAANRARIEWEQLVFPEHGSNVPEPEADPPR